MSRRWRRRRSRRIRRRRTDREGREAGGGGGKGQIERGDVAAVFQTGYSSFISFAVKITMF